MSPRHGAAERVPPPRRDREHHPSFSAALLDAIYHSLDGDACEPDADLIRRANVSPEDRPPPPPPCGRRHSTASSPSGSSSSSRSPRSQKPPRHCRVRPHPQPPSLILPPPTPVLPPGDGEDEKRKIRRKKRRDRSAPFACLLNALLCNRKPPASSAPIATTATRAPLPAIKAEPASARSIMSSRASRSRRESAASAPGRFLQTPGRRAVRFSPAVEIVGDEEQGCGARTAIRLRDVSGSGTEVAAAPPRESAAEAERRVEELLRALGAAEERERAKESSESSSDLFELDSLPAALEGGIGLPRTRAAGLAPPRPRVLVDDMVV